MSTTQDPDLMRAASHRHMAAHLTGPFAAGAVNLTVPVGKAGVVNVDWTSREPLLTVAPRVPLGGVGWRLEAVLQARPANQRLLPVEFAPYTEAGASLPLHLPAVHPTLRTAAPFRLTLSLFEVAPDGSQTAVAAAQLAARLEVNLTEGVLGRLLYLLGAEKLRLRRQGREIAAARMIAGARDDSLDRIGADLGVARFADEIRYDTARREIVTSVRLDSGGAPTAEPDEEYRTRLRLYRPTLVPTRRNLLALLNGEGLPSGEDLTEEQRRGLLPRLGAPGPFELLEADNQLAVAIQIVGAGSPNFRDNFFRHIRAVHLLWPANSTPANTAHAQRYIPVSRRLRIDELRTRLRQNFTFDANAALAPSLADALDRVGRCRRALGVTTQWNVFRAQDSGGGSRYELGLGVDLEVPPAAELTQMRDRLLAANRAPAADPGIERLLRSMQPATAAADPEGAWLLQACGLKTVHRLAAGSRRLYVSHLPTYGLTINAGGAPTLGPSEARTLESRYFSPGDVAGNVTLAEGLAASLTRWTGEGQRAWANLTAADAATRWGQAVARPSNDPALRVFREAGLPAVETPAPVVEQLRRVPPELMQTVRLHATFAQRILTATDATRANVAGELRRLANVLRNNNLVSVLPLVSGTDVLLVVGVIGLPSAGINLSERRSTGFRWYAVPLEGGNPTIRPVGSRTSFVAGGPGLWAVVLLGYARRGLTDPYEFRVELPDGELLTLKQYEFLMNLLQHVCPMGVEVNTFSIRRRHVDLDGDGTADPLQPVASRTFRQFRRTRQRGEAGVTLEDNE